jgi:hypothetical protein
MSLSAIITSIAIFFQKNLVASLAIVIILLYLLFRRPKLFLLILFIASLLGGVIYLSLYLSSCRQIPLWQ